MRYESGTKFGEKNKWCPLESKNDVILLIDVFNKIKTEPKLLCYYPFLRS